MKREEVIIEIMNNPEFSARMTKDEEGNTPTGFYAVTINITALGVK